MIWEGEKRDVGRNQHTNKTEYVLPLELSLLKLFWGLMRAFAVLQQRNYLKVKQIGKIKYNKVS